MAPNCRHLRTAAGTKITCRMLPQSLLAAHMPSPPPLGREQDFLSPHHPRLATLSQRRRPTRPPKDITSPHVPRRRSATATRTTTEEVMRHWVLMEGASPARPRGDDGGSKKQEQTSGVTLSWVRAKPYDCSSPIVWIRQTRQCVCVAKEGGGGGSPAKQASREHPETPFKFCSGPQSKVVFLLLLLPLPP
jgi:hypothetical protein